MLSDQADNLRRLVSRVPCSDRPTRGRLTVVSGCKGGVGATTFSLNLAVSLRSLVTRVLLIDSNPLRGDLAMMYRLKGEHDIDDLVAGRCDLRDAISLGPGGIQVIPRFGRRAAMPAAACWQLLRHLEEVGHEFDQIIVDAGSSPDVAEVLWPAANTAMVLTTTEQVAFTDGYALVKAMVHRKICGSQVGFVVNRYQDHQRAIDVLHRLGRSCQQFLDLKTKSLGCVAQDDDWELAVTEARSIACARPASASALAIEHIARQLASGHVDTYHLNPVKAH